MKKSLLVLSIVLLGTLLGSKVMSQTSTNQLTLGMPEVLLVASNTPTIDLTLKARAAGLAVEDTVSNSSARILISSVVSGTQTRILSAAITTGTVPLGTYLRLIALNPNLSFVGTKGILGTTAVEFTSTSLNSSQNIITGIGTCYSGTSALDGYGLKYTFGIPVSTADYGSIRANSATAITVTLTISAGA